MKRTPILTAVAMAAVFSVSCKNKGASELAIPKDATAVVYINSSSLTSKLSWEEIKATSWFKDASEDATDSLAKKLLENPENSGVDTKSDFAFFMKKQGKGGYMVFEGKIKDAAAFEALLKKMNKEAVVQTDGKLKYIKTGENEMVSWNDSRFISITDAPMSGANSFSYGNYTEQKFTVDSLKKFTNELLNLKSDNSLDQDDRYTAMIKEPGDVHFWVNAEKYASELSGGMFSMMKLNMLFDGNVSASTLNFDNGKITMKSKQYYGPEMSKILDKYEPKPVPAALINRIPSQNVVGAMVMNYPPEGMKAFFKAAGIDGFANMFLGKMNYSFDELMQAYNGEVLLAVSDVAMVKQKQTVEGTDYTYETTKPDMKVLFAASVKDKASFEKLVNIATEQMKDKEDLSKINYKVTNEWFAAGNSAEGVDKFLAGGNNQVPFASKISGHPFGMYVDIQKIMKTAGSMTSGSPEGTAAMDASVNMWQDVVITGGEYKNGSMSVEFVVNLVDGKTNSLKQINQYAEKLNAARKLRPRMEDATIDTTTVTAPPSVPAQ